MLIVDIAMFSMYFYRDYSYWDGNGQWLVRDISVLLLSQLSSLKVMHYLTWSIVASYWCFAIPTSRQHWVSFFRVVNAGQLIVMSITLSMYGMAPAESWVRHELI